MPADPDPMRAIEQMTRALDHAAATVRMMGGLLIRHPNCQATDLVVAAAAIRKAGDDINEACRPVMHSLAMACEMARKAGREEVLAELEASRAGLAETGRHLRVVGDG